MPDQDNAPNDREKDETSDDDVVCALSFKEALETRRAELMAMPSDQVIRGASIDASAAASLAEATAKKLRRYRAGLVAEFGERAGVVVDRLSLAARATKQADIEVARTKRSTDLSDLHAEVSKHYGFLRTEAQSLVNRDLLDGKELEAANEILGYQALLDSTLILVSIFRDYLPALSTRTPVTNAHLDAAERAAQHMTITIAHRDHGVERLAAIDLRARALTALIRDYNDIRRKLSYLRWDEEDADEIAPSFWATRRGRKRGSGGANEPPEFVSPPPQQESLSSTVQR